MKCISCAHEHHENFCPNCGERNGVQRITMTSIAEFALASVTNMDKGFLYNFKTLFKNPKDIILEYLAGKRKSILNPVSYLIFSVTIYLIITSNFEPTTFFNKNKVAVDSGSARLFYEAGYFTHKYIKLFWIGSIFPMAIGLKVLYRKFNFPEYLSISSFIIGHATLIVIITYLIFRIPLILDPFLYLVMLFLIFRIFKDKRDVFGSFLIASSVLVLFFIQWILIIILVGYLRT